MLGGKFVRGWAILTLPFTSVPDFEVGLASNFSLFSYFFLHKHEGRRYVSCWEMINRISYSHKKERNIKLCYVRREVGRRYTKQM